ncbi:MAG: cob(I)alamin adenosyltransferase [Saprospiraceae bacterium]|jgi:cob(I)alamin adenosyltransferase
MKVYTKTGDKGSTSLIGGSRIKKDDLRIEAYGTVDELNSFVGLLSDKITLLDVTGQLARIQQSLFVVGSNLACREDEKPKSIPKLESNEVTLLENYIDTFEKELVPMTNFILPSGHEQVSLTHCVRTICRRAERRVVSLQNEPEIVVYLNRLSDYFFVLSRLLAKKLNVDEVKWMPTKS